MIISALEWLGRQGTRAIALSLFAGMAFPQLSSLAQPILPGVVLCMLVLAFIRVDAHAALARIKRPLLPFLCIVWMMLLIPLLMGAILTWSDLEARAPGLAVALMLISAGAPIMSTPAFSYILGLDGVLSLSVLILGQSLLPFAAPAMADLFLVDALPLTPQGLGLRLAVLLLGALAVALPIRRFVGAARLQQRKHAFDGANIVMLYLFAVSIMDGVVARFILDPWLILGVTAVSFAVLIIFLALTTLLFLKAGLTQALTLGLSAGNRNMGLFAAALAGHAPELTMIYFAVGQFPVYLLPWVIDSGLKRYRKPVPSITPYGP